MTNLIPTKEVKAVITLHLIYNITTETLVILSVALNAPLNTMHVCAPLDVCYACLSTHFTVL